MQVALAILPVLAFSSASVATSEISVSARSAGSEITCVPKNYRRGRRVVSSADWHGDWDHVLELLRLVGIIDENGKWIAGNSTFVQTGDVLDRGPEGKRLYLDLLFPLKEQAEAPQNGGTVALLVGDHELFALWGYPKYASNYDFCFYTEDPHACLKVAGWPTEDHKECQELDKCCHYNDCATNRSACPPGNCEHIEAWSLHGSLGRTFREKTLSAFQVSRAGNNDVVYAHAGITPGLQKMYPSVENINKHGKMVFTNDNAELYNSDDVLLDSKPKEDGPFWTRICWSDSHDWNTTEAQLCSDVEASLHGLRANRMVIGHCPAPKGDDPGPSSVFNTGWGGVESKCGGRFLLADTLLSQAYTEQSCENPQSCTQMVSEEGAAERSRHNEVVVEYYDEDASGKVWLNYPRRTPPECHELPAPKDLDYRYV